MHTIKLHHKTQRGRNKLNEAGNPEHWIVLEQRDYVSFSDRNGPWIHVQPTNNSKDKSRWVSMTDDHDFTVEVIR